MDEIQFKSAFDAVRFALCYSTQQYGETMMAKRLKGESVEKGMGLVGLDGAGQSGQIRREMWELPDLHLAVLIARAAPHDVPCDCGQPCCSKHRRNSEWEAAIVWLTEASTAYVSGFSHYQVRRTIIENIFSPKKQRKSLVDIADHCRAHRNTVSNQNAAVRRWIEGNRKTGELGVEEVARAAIERRFGELGLVKSDVAA
ncbi:DNA-binding protein [Paraburkholderia sp. Clong3]|uniref:DNA-binding protein n=1 Tax=Paraburkholderia sp. Clong3 TaxID=2991061 RepID=UPI003D219014